MLLKDFDVTGAQGILFLSRVEITAGYVGVDNRKEIKIIIS